MKQNRYPFKAILISCAVLSFVLPDLAFAAAGKFQFVNGEVQVLDASGKARAVKKGDAIDEGETVSSGANGFAQIRMEDGGFFAVRPETEFKIDTFKYEGKDDGSEKGVFSLVKGSLRAVTGVVGKKHKDNYKVNTATATIGIRGSGMDAGHDGKRGTAVRTLFGGHSLTSNGKTINTGPGQTAMAAPGQEPKFVPSFPFNTSTTGSGNANNQDGGGDDGGTQQSGPYNESNNQSATTGNDDKVVIPIVDTDGNLNLTNLTQGDDPIGDGFAYAGTGKLPSGNYVHYISALKNSSGIFVAEQESDEGYYSPSNYTFDTFGALVGVADSGLELSFADQSIDMGSSSLTVVGGTLEEMYHTPDNSIFIARASNVSVNTVCMACSGTDVFVNVYSLVALANAPAFVQTLTGSTNYTLAGGLRPSDAQGNVGTLNNAYINANFTNMTVDFGLSLSIAGKTIDAYATSVAIVHDGFGADSDDGLNVSCTGACVAAGYYGDVGGGFFGNAAGTAAMGYDFWPDNDNSLPGPNDYYTEYIHGMAAFVAGSAPTAIPSTAGVVGGGGAAVGSFTSSPGDDFNDFNVVDNLYFSSRHDLSGNLIAWTNKDNDTSFAARGTVVQDGADASLGVVWGRWSSFSATADTMSGALNLPTQGGLSFITGSHITTSSELGALAITGNYSMATAGVASIPTGINGVASGAITSASATVNFSSGAITAFNVAGSGGGYGAWSASGSGTIANFMTSTGLALTGSCSGGSGSCVMSDTLNGKAVGAFVGSQAQGLISTVGLQATGGDKLGGAVYMRR